MGWGQVAVQGNSYPLWFFFMVSFSSSFLITSARSCCWRLFFCRRWGTRRTVIY